MLTASPTPTPAGHGSYGSSSYLSSPPSTSSPPSNSKIEKFESLSVSSMGLNDNDKKFYEQIWKKLDHMGTGLVPLGTMAIHSLLERSGLNRTTADKVLGLVDPYERKVLDKKAVYVLLRLISCVQNDCPASYPALTVHTDLSLPKIRGVELEPDTPSSQSSHSTPLSTSPPPSSLFPTSNSMNSLFGVSPMMSSPVLSPYASPQPSPRSSPMKSNTNPSRSEFSFEQGNSQYSLVSFGSASNMFTSPPLPSPSHRRSVDSRRSSAIRHPIHDLTAGSSPPLLRQTQSLINLHLGEDISNNTPTPSPPHYVPSPRSSPPSLARTVSSPGMFSPPPPPLPTIPLPPNFPTMPPFESVVWPPQPPPLTDMDRLWILSEKEMRSYREIFNEYDTNHDGFMSGKEARAFFVKSKIEKETLSRIWKLSDLDKDGKLNVNEFCICMHLTMGVSKKLCLLPPTLPRILDPRISDPRNPMTTLFNLSLDPHEIQEGKRVEQRRLHMAAVSDYVQKNPEQKAILDELIHTKLTSTRFELNFVTEKLQQVTSELEQIKSELQQYDSQLDEQQRVVESLYKDSLDLKLEISAKEADRDRKREKLDWSKKFIEQAQTQTDALRLQIQESEVEGEIIEQELQYQTAMLADVRELRQHQVLLVKTRLQRLPPALQASLGLV